MTKTRKKKIFQSAAGAAGAAGLILLAIALLIQSSSHTPVGLRINELAFSQEEGVDWIEIYNSSFNNLSLKGFYLTDEADDLSKFEIKEELAVPAGGFALIYGKDYRGDEEAIKANFKIAAGETIYLIAKDGRTVVDSLSVWSGDVKNNLTIGRYPDGSENIFLMSQATKAAANKK